MRCFIVNNEQDVLTFWQIYNYMCALKGMSPWKTGGKMGISSATVNNWKNGGEPNDVTVNKVSEYFGIENGIIRNMLSANKHGSEQTKQYFRQNWQKYVAAAMPGVKPMPELAEEGYVITKQDLTVLEHKINTAKAFIEDVEHMIAEIKKSQK